MNGFVNTFLSGEWWYLFNKIQPQYLYGKQFRIAVYSTSNKKSNIYVGHTKYIRLTPIENV